MLLRCDIIQGRSVSVGVSMKKLVVGSVEVFVRVH